MEVRLRGFSLLESLLAGLILCLVLFVIVSLYPTSLFGMKQGHELITASNLAQKILEEKRAQTFDSVAGEPPAEVTCDGTPYRYEIAVTGSPDGTPDVKNVRVDVSWTSVGSRSVRTVTFETRLFRFRNP